MDATNTTKTTAGKTYAVKCGECKVTVRRSHQRGTRETCPQCRAKADAAYLTKQSPTAIDSAKIRAAMMKLHGCIGCGGRDEHRSFTCPVLAADISDARVSR